MSSVFTVKGKKRDATIAFEDEIVSPGKENRDPRRRLNEQDAASDPITRLAALDSEEEADTRQDDRSRTENNKSRRSRKSNAKFRKSPAGIIKQQEARRTKSKAKLEERLARDRVEVSTSLDVTSLRVSGIGTMASRRLAARATLDRLRSDKSYFKSAVHTLRPIPYE